MAGGGPEPANGHLSRSAAGPRTDVPVYRSRGGSHPLGMRRAGPAGGRTTSSHGSPDPPPPGAHRVGSVGRRDQRALPRRDDPARHRGRRAGDHGDLQPRGHADHGDVRSGAAHARAAAGVDRRQVRRVRRDRRRRRRVPPGGRVRIAVALQGARRIPHHRGGLDLRPSRFRRSRHRLHTADPARRPGRASRGSTRSSPGSRPAATPRGRCTSSAGSSSSASSARWAASSTAGSAWRSCNGCSDGPRRGRAGHGFADAAAVDSARRAGPGPPDTGGDRASTAGRPSRG